MMDIGALKFDAAGLIPAIVQDHLSRQVLMVAYMSRESLRITLDEGRTCFYSRSRKALWRKGETSGSVQRVVSVTADCDGDALLVLVTPQGPACHTGEVSCFHNPVLEGAAPFSLDGLYRLIDGRRTEKKEGSYTSYLFDKGREKILKKVGEECTEVVIGAMKDSRTETVYEIADLCYHVMVLMSEMGIAPAEVLGELAGRHVVDTKTKQETAQAKGGG